MIAIPELDELTITIVVDNTTDTLSSIAPGCRRFPRSRTCSGVPRRTGQHDGHDCVVVFDHLCVACHGFSALATARRGDRSTTVLFDVGPYGDVWLANAERLAVDLSSIDVLFPVALALGPHRRHHLRCSAIATRATARAYLHSSSTCTPIDPTDAGSSPRSATSPCFRQTPQSKPSKRQAAQ